MSHTVVVGADAAGLSAAYELSKNRCAVTVLEADSHVGGLYWTERYQDYCIDLSHGGFVTDLPRVCQLWDELLPAEDLCVDVRSLLHYHHRLFNHPLSLTNAIKHIGPTNFSLVGISYIRTWLNAQQTQPVDLETAQSWTESRFGKHLSRIFFEPYLKSLWGLSSEQLTQACGQHCIDSTLIKEAWSAVLGRQTARTVRYPKNGMGSVWKNCKTLIEQMGSMVSLASEVVEIKHSKGRVEKVVVKVGDRTTTLSVEHFISSLPLPKLVKALNAPKVVAESANQLRYRHLITISLIVDSASLFDEQCMYVHQPDVQVSRIQNSKNWSADMAPDDSTTCLGLFYLCDVEDGIWSMSERELIQLASAELIELGVIQDFDLVRAGKVVRTLQAYPVSTVHDLQPLGIVQDYLNCFENLQSIGQNGTHRLSHLDAEMQQGLEAAATVLIGQNLSHQSKVRQSSGAVLQSLQTLS